MWLEEGMPAGPVLQPPDLCKHCSLTASLGKSVPFSSQLESHFLGWRDGSSGKGTCRKPC